MSNRAQAILKQALELSDSEQLEIAGMLLRGSATQPETGYDKAWEAELRRRLDAADRGEMAWVDEEEADKLMFGDDNGQG